MQEANNYTPGKFERYIISITVIGEESERQRAIELISYHTMQKIADHKNVQKGVVS